MALTIHQAGIDAAINAQANGFAGVTLNRVELYNGSTRVATLPLEGVQVIEPGRVYVVAQDSSTATYDVQRIDFYTSTGVKFATAQNDDGSVIQSKAANTTLLLAHQLNIASAPGSVAPSGDVSVYAPQATESLLGTAEIATQGETDAGADDARFVTPKKLGQWLRNKLSSSVTSTSTTTPASVKGVKAAYDKAVSVLSSLNSHTGNKSNPHGVSKSQVGLGSVNNWGATSSTSDGSSSKYATAAGVKAAYASGTRQATESLRGQVELATQSEVDAGADGWRAVTPKSLTRWWNIKKTDLALARHNHSASDVTGLPEPEFAIISVNNGAGLASAGRYIHPNPFPGQQVILVAEVYLNGVWGATGWHFNAPITKSYGVVASQQNDNIIIQAGTYVIGTSRYGGDGFNSYQTISWPKHCRVKVWKVK